MVVLRWKSRTGPELQLRAGGARGSCWVPSARQAAPAHPHPSMASAYGALPRPSLPSIPSGSSCSSGPKSTNHLLLHSPTLPAHSREKARERVPNPGATPRPRFFLTDPSRLLAGPVVVATRSLLPYQPVCHHVAILLSIVPHFTKPVQSKSVHRRRCLCILTGDQPSKNVFDRFTFSQSPQ